MDLRDISRLLYQIKLTNQEINTLFEKETGFSLTRYEMLLFLKEKGICSQNQVQTELKIDSAAITRHLKILEKKGYVIRKRNAENNREVFVQLSEKAIQDLEACGKEHDQGKTSLSLSLSDEEAQQLSYLLNKLYLKR
ncbi:helix turn helix multiple antibiotic resistance protein [Trichococcus palustris]|uniref:Helix turn helix multiple antibiotic resistance protein n=1 Tax=Trichococcus palustris TaxID=140314 RepID=A0A143YHH0_9LACT|nr:MarR family transcriptional regulator [Trichococcus palustris]CZQ90168.1 helix turn helix multiple antibiotic resistance protein [Trichococcus palustris]SFK99265.1 DNA-binding transcriptional regulator, MarR family [Trichococcus palustris]